MYRILIIEDDEMLREDLAAELSAASYEPLMIEDFSRCAEMAAVLAPDLILLDVMLPGMDGYTLCRSLRRAMDVPVIFLTSKDTEMDEVYGMSLGADDFIRKPYSFPVLKARIDASLRRSKKSGPLTQIRFRELTLDLEQLRLLKGGKSLDLTLNEFHIVKYMFTHPGEIVRRADLIEYLWDNQVFIDDNTLSVNMARLRTHLDVIGEKELIKTKYGQGYYL